MSSNKERIRRYILEEIERQHKFLQLLDILPDHPLVDFCNGAVRLPFDWKTFKEYRRAMGKGWRQNGWMTTSHSNGVAQHTTYTHPEFGSIHFALDTKMNGSTCRKVQVGTKEVPVYEIFCDDDILFNPNEVICE